MKLKALLRALVGLSVGAAIIYLVMHLSGTSLEDLIARLRSLPWWAFAVASLGWLVLNVFQAIRWYIVLMPVHTVKLWTLYRSILVGFAVNSFLPARLGDFARIEYVSRRSGASRAKILATGLVDMWSDKLGFLVAVPFILLFGQPPAWMARAALLMGVAVLVVGAIFVLLGRRHQHVGTDPSAQPGKFATFIQNFRAGLGGQNWKRQMALLGMASPLAWIWEALVLMALAPAFGFSLNLMQAFAVLTAFNLAMVIPAPGNAGTFEAGASLALIAFGVPKDSAIAFSFIYHLCQLVTGVLTGMFVLAQDGQSLFPRLTQDRRKTEPTTGGSLSRTKNSRFPPVKNGTPTWNEIRTRPATTRAPGTPSGQSPSESTASSSCPVKMPVPRSAAASRSS